MSCGLCSCFSYYCSVWLLWLLCYVMYSWFGLCGLVVGFLISLLCVSSDVMCWCGI